MIDVRGKTQEEAQQLLTDAGLSVTIAKSEYNESVEEGRVIDQSIVPDKFVDKGTGISLTISLGKQTVYYSYSTTIEVPQDGKEYVSADISILDADGKQLQRWKKVKASTMPQLLKIDNIADSSTGVLKIVWTYKDENGDPQTVEDSQNINFTAQ